MIVLKFILFAVLCIIVDCREFGRFIGRGNVRHRQPVEEFNYNHPPASENYEAIPVAVVYEDEGSRKDKSVVRDVPETSKVQQVSRGTPRSKPNVTIKPNVTGGDSSENIDFNPNKVEITKEYNLKPTEQPTAEAEQEHQIPVAVVYEPESPYYKEARPTGHRVVTKRRKVQRPVAEERRVAPAAEEKQTAAVVEENRTDPVVEEKRTVTAAEIKRVGTVAEHELVAPAVKEERVDLAAEVNLGTLAAEKKEVAGVAEKRRVVPALQEKRVFIKEAIDEDNQPNAYDITSNQKIRDNSESKQTQQFPKRDSSTVRRKDVVPIVQSENLVFSHSGDFQYSYEGGDGTKAFEKGQLKTYQDDNAGEAVSGGFSYTAKDGNKYSLTYTADENGYRPMGAHLPTSPPIPPAIARALAYLATKTTPEPVTDSIKESDTDY